MSETKSNQLEKLVSKRKDNKTSTFNMGNALISSIDQLDFREWCDLTPDTTKCIDFCQRVGLIGYTLNEGCGQDHRKWKLGSSSRMNDGWVWRCATCKNTKSIRHSTFFSNSKLNTYIKSSILCISGLKNSTHIRFFGAIVNSPENQPLPTGKTLCATYAVSTF